MSTTAAKPAKAQRRKRTIAGKTRSALTRVSAAAGAVPEKWRTILMGIKGFNPFTLAAGYRFDEEAAQRALDFFPLCIKHVKGAMAGKPFELQPWEAAIIANAFGWKSITTGLRRFREVFIYVAKKNGKTAFVAGVLLLVMTLDGEMGAELYSAAATRDQAGLLFSHASGMVKLDDELSARLRIYGDKGGSQTKSIVYDDEMSTYKCLAADANTADGVNPHFIAADELHRHKSPELVEVLIKSTAARTQPLTFCTTTADYNRPSLCNSKLAYARSVRDNPGDPEKPGFDPTFLPVIYEACKDDDWRDPETWAKANPNLGVTVMPDFLQREAQKAGETPSELNNFLRLHLNIVTDAAEAFFDMEHWDAPPNKNAISESELQGRSCYGGLDLSSTKDLSSFQLVFPPPLKDGQADVDADWTVLTRLFMPEDNMERRERNDHVPYSTWVRQGLIMATPGNVIDYDFIKDQIARDLAAFQVREIGFDNWSAAQIAVQLQELGATMVDVRQGFKTLSEPMKLMEKLVISGRLRHGGHAALRWMAGNVTASRDPAGNIKPDKSKSSEKIDGIVATITALSRAMLGGGSGGPSVYETRGLLVI